MEKSVSNAYRNKADIEIGRNSAEEPFTFFLKNIPFPLHKEIEEWFQFFFSCLPQEQPYLKSDFIVLKVVLPIRVYLASVILQWI